MKVHLVYLNSDWEGLYVDGVLRCEGHGIGPEETIDAIRHALPIHTIEFGMIEIEDEHTSSLPIFLDDLRELYLEQDTTRG